MSAAGSNLCVQAEYLATKSRALAAHLHSLGRLLVANTGRLSQPGALTHA
jgi:hypothetical protein